LCCVFIIIYICASSSKFHPLNALPHLQINSIHFPSLFQELQPTILAGLSFM
jgi:hypothetical protein